jgi:chromosome segregation ATPase
MSDDPKRRPSVSSKRVRLDTRAEPNSPSRHEEESVPRGRPAQPVRGKPALEGRGVRIGPGPIERAARAMAEGSGDINALRRQIAALQQELTTTQHRLATTQEERIEETDRMSEMLARVTVLEAANRDAEERLARATASPGRGDDATKERLAEAEGRAAAQLTELLKVQEALEQERETSAWLRVAGEQATREVAAFRARATAPHMKSASDEDEELARVRADLDTANKELAGARASIAEANDKARGREEELVSAKAAVAFLGKELDAARATASSKISSLEGEVRELKEASTLTGVQPAGAPGTVASLEEELRAAKAVASATTTQLEEAKAAITKLQAKVADAAKDSEEQIGAMATQLSSNVEALEGLRAEKEAIAKELAQATNKLWTSATSMTTLRDEKDALAKEVAEGAAKLEASAAALTTLRAQKEVLEKDLAQTASQLSASNAATGPLRTQKETLEKDLAEAKSQLSASAAEMSALRGERDSLKSDTEALATAALAAQERAVAATLALDSTTGMLATLIRSHEALEAGEEAMEKLRVEARSSRTAIADQTIALRLALSRVADAVAVRAADAPPDDEIEEVDADDIVPEIASRGSDAKELGAK